MVIPPYHHTHQYKRKILIKPTSNKIPSPPRQTTLQPSPSQRHKPPQSALQPSKHILLLLPFRPPSPPVPPAAPPKPPLLHLLLYTSSNLPPGRLPANLPPRVPGCAPPPAHPGDPSKHDLDRKLAQQFWPLRPTSSHTPPHHRWGMVAAGAGDAVPRAHNGRRRAHDEPTTAAGGADGA